MAVDEWRSGGYFLMGPVAEGALKDARLPRLVWSISTCVSDSYPDEKYLTWVRTSPERDEELRRTLGLSPEALVGLKAEVTDLFDRGLIRWPNVFASVAAARDFHGRWLNNLDQVRLLGISLKKEHVAEFENDVAGLSNPGDGVLGLLTEDVPPVGGELWGFEVLGSEFGTFHTYLCHGLETELMDVVKVRFNDRGLIEEWAGAEAASEWINRDGVGAEPVPWYPWRIDAYTVGCRLRRHGDRVNEQCSSPRT